MRPFRTAFQIARVLLQITSPMAWHGFEPAPTDLACEMAQDVVVVGYGPRPGSPRAAERPANLFCQPDTGLCV